MDRPILMAIVGPGGVRSAGEAARGGADLIQVRARELGGRELIALVRAVIDAVGAPGRVVVNSRPDIAELAGAGGVHLPESGLDPREVRRSFPRLLLGVSRHSRAGLLTGAEAGADYAILGPVFSSPGKEDATCGLEGLESALSGIPLPILAVGGLSAHNCASALARGARGVAAIRPFANESAAHESALAFRRALDATG